MHVGMKRIALACILLASAAPALATGGFDCRATDNSGLGLAGTTGRVVITPLVGARLTIGQQTLATDDPEPAIVVGQSWIDDREIRIDLVDPNFERIEAQLRARIVRPGIATGTLVREGRTHPVRCEIE